MDSDKDHIKIKWSSPISNGGSPIIGYDVERRDRATGRWIKVNKDPIPGTEFNDDHVQAGHEYEYRVSAVNAAGVGKPSDTSSAFVAKPMKGNLSGLIYKVPITLHTFIFRETKAVVRRIDWTQDQSARGRTGEYRYSDIWCTDSSGFLDQEWCACLAIQPRFSKFTTSNKDMCAKN